jgi:hypothetical protein
MPPPHGRIPPWRAGRRRGLGERHDRADLNDAEGLLHQREHDGAMVVWRRRQLEHMAMDILVFRVTVASSGSAGPTPPFPFCLPPPPLGSHASERPWSSCPWQASMVVASMPVLQCGAGSGARCSPFFSLIHGASLPCSPTSLPT